jgi:hypothetical protein
MFDLLLTDQIIRKGNPARPAGTGAGGAMRPRGGRRIEM